MTAPTATADTADVADAGLTVGPSRRVRALATIRWTLARLAAIVVFAAGAALGYNAFLAQQPPAITADTSAATEPPAVVREFIAALTSNDADALRSAVPTDAYRLLIAEMSRWEYQRVTGVEVLDTVVDGPRAATELVMSGVSASGVTVSVNLIVHVADGQIVSFR